MSTELERVLSQSKAFVDAMVQEELNGKPFSRSLIEESIVAFYAMQKRPRPQIVWFQNPWQLHYGPGLYEGYRRKQFLIYAFVTELANTVRGLLEEQMGKRETGYVIAAIQSLIPARSLSTLSRTIDREIDLLARETDHHPQGLCSSLFKTCKEAIPASESRLRYMHEAERLGCNIGWYQLDHVINMECPWEHINADLRTPFGPASLGLDSWGPRRAPKETPFHLPAPGAEWSHFLRMGIASVSIAQRFIGLKLIDELAEAAVILQTLANSVHSIACFNDVCFVSEPPVSVSRDEEGRFHHMGGPSIEYAGQFSIYCWHGTRVTQAALTGEVTVDRIQNENNTEVMRILLERYGIEEFLRDSQAQHVQEDETGVLYKVNGGPWADSIALVGVVNSTAEPDGTFKRYFLRVPPDTTSAREGVAWTFSLAADDYAPNVQS
jgi:hypothetical protein